MIHPLLAAFGVLFLLLLCGLFSMIEIALVLCRESRLRATHEPDEALDLVRSPDAALSAIQAGITLSAVIAGAFALAGFAAPLGAWLRGLTGWSGWVDIASAALVLTGVTLALLWLGELLPKRIGLAYPERIVRLAARPLRIWTTLSGPLVRALDRLADLTAARLRLHPAAMDSVSEDDVKLLVREGGKSGALLPAESVMVEAVLGLDRLRVRELMTPRNEIVWLDADMSPEQLTGTILASGHSRFPLFRTRRDNLLGVIDLRDVMRAIHAGETPDLVALAKPAVLVPPTQPVLLLLDTFRKATSTFAVVADEFGGITGVVTMYDAMQAIVGDFQSGENDEEEIVARGDGSWLVDASIHPDDFASHFPGFPSEVPEHRDYVTMNGFVLRHLGHIPATGESFEAGDYRIEVVDLDRNRVDKLLVSPRKA
jgi:putative hemolysin